jgi:chromosomal replication initiation ATPase DnaA
VQQLPLGVQLEVSSRFETFRAGTNLAAIEELCALGKRVGQPPLWLAGPEASGKTHLMQAACVRLSERGTPATYLPLRRHAEFAPGLLSGCERLGAVFLDDLDAVAGDPAWEGALFTLHNELQEHGGRLVASSRQPRASTSSSRCRKPISPRRWSPGPRPVAWNSRPRPWLTCCATRRGISVGCAACWTKWTPPRWPASGG